MAMNEKDGSYAQNEYYAKRAAAIKYLHVMTPFTQTEIASFFQIAPAQVNQIISNKNSDTVKRSGYVATYNIVSEKDPSYLTVTHDRQVTHTLTAQL